MGSDLHTAIDTLVFLLKKEKDDEEEEEFISHQSSVEELREEKTKSVK